MLSESGYHDNRNLETTRFEHVRIRTVANEYALASLPLEKSPDFANSTFWLINIQG